MAPLKRHAICLALLVLLLPAATLQSAAEDAMTWQFYEANDPENKGAMTARLVYGVPETDNVQMTGVCDARPSTGVKFSSVTFGADIGDLANGAEADLRFSGGGFEQTLHGTVQRAEGEGMSGVHVDIANNDPIWTAFADKDSLDYLVPGYRAATLKFEPGKAKIASFVEACRTYEKAVLWTGEMAEAEPAGNNAEKDAFESAKELGTVSAFEAFLANYPTGFYADLARAYVEKLAAAAPQAVPPAPSVAAADPGPDPSCKDLFKVKSQGSDTPTKITIINKSGMYRSILWLDFSGQPKDYAGLNDGEQVTLDTFLTHPWMVADGPGNCIEIVMPHAGSRVVTLTGTDGASGQAPPPPTKKAAPPPAPAPKKKAATPKCRARSVLIDGKCVLKSNAAGYCGPGYRLKGSKCVPGAYVAPTPKKSTHGCPPGQVWNAQEGCHYDD